MTTPFDDLATPTIVACRIAMTPCMLGKQYKEHLLREAKRKMEKTSDKQMGVLLRVEKIHRILKENIGTMIPEVLCRVSFDVLAYRPCVGDHIQMTIQKIFHHGVFFQDILRVLIPSSDCSPFVIQKDFSSFFLQHKTTILRKGDPATILIRQIRFEKDGFSCIGKLVTDLQ